MGIVHERPGWWMESDRPTVTDRVSTGPPGTTDDSSMVVVFAQVRPMGQRSTFTTRPMTCTCLNCGEWIHSGTSAWYDPDLDESVCARCWPETVTAERHR